LVGPRAESLLDWATTRDIGELYPGKSAHASIKGSLECCAT
jgi:aminomethyltransferase